jgi:hypothetical protein
MTQYNFSFAVVCVYLLRAFMRYALRAAPLMCIQNAPGILVRIKFVFVCLFTNTRLAASQTKNDFYLV